MLGNQFYNVTHVQLLKKTPSHVLNLEYKETKVVLSIFCMEICQFFYSLMLESFSILIYLNNLNNIWKDFFSVN